VELPKKTAKIKNGTEKMKPITYNGEEGYFIPPAEKKQLDKIVKSYLSICGDDCNE